MKLGYLLFLSFGIVILLIAIIGGIAVFYSSKVSQSLEVESTVPRLLLISEIIILILGIFVGYVTTRVISKPLVKFMRGIEIIGKGNLKHKIEIESNDEIGDLALAFNKMTAKLGSSQQKLKDSAEVLKQKSIELKKISLNTQRKAQDMANKLTSKLQDFKLALEGSSEQIIITDSEARIIFANMATSRLTGYSHSEIIGKTPALWGNQMSEGYYKKMWHRIKTDKKEYVGEIVNKRKNGKRYTASINIIPVLDDKKNIKLFLGFERDTTEQKKIEKIKEEKNKQKREIKKLEEIDSLKTEFLSFTSHELRTPLTPIRSQLQRLLSKKLNPEKQQKSLTMILRNTIRLDKLINDVLEISRIESKRLKLDYLNVDVKELIDHVVLTMKPLAQDKDIILTVNVESLPEIQLDRDRIEQVLINLTDNAIRHGKPTEIVITAKAKEGKIIICVKDNGQGINSQELPNIFKLFFVGKEELYIHKGAGIGLPICKGIVEAHGGKIWVKSPEGKGSSFFVSLPLKQTKKNLNKKRKTKK